MEAETPDHEREPTDGAVGGTAALRSVSIAMRVLDAFAQAPELGASEVGRRVGISKSTAHRTLVTLAAGGLLEHTAEGRYRLGLRLLELGQIAANRNELRRRALPIMTALHRTLNEAVQLGLPAGAEVHFVERVGSGTNAELSLDPYRRTLAHRSSAGKALAAFNPEMAKACIAAGLRPATGHTITEVPHYLAILGEVRRRGWALSVEETALGWSSLAVPVLLEGQTPEAVAALSVVGPSARVSERFEMILPPLLDAAQQLAAAVRRR